MKMSFKFSDTVRGLFSVTGNPGYYLLLKSLLNDKDDSEMSEEDLERR